MSNGYEPYTFKKATPTRPVISVFEETRKLNNQKRALEGLTREKTIKKPEVLKKNDHFSKRIRTEGEKSEEEPVDPREFARRLFSKAAAKGDETPGESASRPFDGVAGLDSTFSTKYRYKKSRDTKYYTQISPWPSYQEFLRMSFHMVDGDGIMYTVTDQKVAADFFLPKRNVLLRESIRPISEDLIKESMRKRSEATGGSINSVLLWFAKPKTKKATLSFPWETQAVLRRSEAIRVLFYHPKILDLPVANATIRLGDVRMGKNNLTGCVTVNDFRVVNSISHPHLFQSNDDPFNGDDGEEE